MHDLTNSFFGPGYLNTYRIKIQLYYVYIYLITISENRHRPHRSAAFLKMVNIFLKNEKKIITGEVSENVYKWVN